MVVDSICHEYGWSIDQVFACTKAQILALSESIGKRKDAEQTFLATIHGAEMKSTQDNTTDAGDTNQLRRMGIHVVEE